MCSSDYSIVLAIIIVLVIVLIFLWVGGKKNTSTCDGFVPGFQNSLTKSLDAVQIDGPQSVELAEAFDHLFNTEDVDPLITGQVYTHRDNTRDVYAERTSSLSSDYGLQEFSSSGGSGDVGVDVGPYGLAEYGGSSTGSDDGIPSEWAFPSTPIRDYVPKDKADYYGSDGPVIQDPEKLYPLWVQDNEPSIGEDTDE